MEEKRLIEFSKEELIAMYQRSENLNNQLVGRFNELQDSTRRLLAFRDVCSSAQVMSVHSEYTDVRTFYNLVTEAEKGLGYIELPEKIGL